MSKDRNHYQWNDATEAARQTPEAYVLHLGINALCDHLADIADQLRGIRDIQR